MKKWKRVPEMSDYGWNSLELESSLTQWKFKSTTLAVRWEPPTSEKVEESARSGWLRMELTGTPQFLDSMKIRNCNPSGENRQWVKKWKRAPEVGDYGWNWLELESTLASAAAETHVHSAHAQRTVALTTGETSPHPVHYARNQTTRRCKFQDKTFAKSSTY